MGHHGSHYSTCQQFLDTVRPEYAVISCSSTNTYGHPSPEITKRLEETGCQTSFTMESGAVKVCWEKEGIRIKKFLEKGNSMQSEKGTFIKTQFVVWFSRMSGTALSPWLKESGGLLVRS